MAYSVKKLVTDITYGYGLSGERRQASYKNWRRYMVANALLGVLGVIIGVLFTNQVGLSAIFYYAVAAVTVVVLALYGFVKQDTGWQLWFREREVIKKNRKDNLEELHDHAKKIKHESRHAK